MDNHSSRHFYQHHLRNLSLNFWIHWMVTYFIHFLFDKILG